MPPTEPGGGVISLLSVTSMPDPAEGVVIRGTMWPGYPASDGGVWNVPRWSEVYPAEPVH